MELGVQYFRTLARYNAWANTRLYDACARLSDAERRADRKAFFGSIHGTLNHLLAGDRIWMGRIQHREHGITHLDVILYDDFEMLRQARAAEDAAMIAYMDGLAPDDMLTILEYQSFTAGKGKTPLPLIMGHMFNHQTHHRGQVHAMLTQTAVPAPSLDLLLYLRAAEDAASTA